MAGSGRTLDRFASAPSSCGSLPDGPVQSDASGYSFRLRHLSEFSWAVRNIASTCRRSSALG